ncbi:MAG: prenyltransferase [Bacillota bacterium]|nr:prenyltransferase [Bacillota bacterium]
MQKYNRLTIKLGFRLAAPHTWAASVIPAIFGCVYCLFKGYSLNICQIIALILASILMQSSVNTLNDYIDYKKGTDKISDTLERSDAVLLYENINPKDALALGLGYLAIATIIGFVLILTIKSLIPLYIGLIGALAVVFYSGGKTPISYLPIGEFVSGFVMGGLIPMGCVAVATGEWNLWVLLFSIPMIISIGLILMTNNTCDIEKDIEANRKTLSVIIGREKARKIYKLHIKIWIVSLWVLPIFLIGKVGILCAVLTHFTARPAMLWMMDSPLDQENRIKQMKTVLKANVMANGSYIITIIAGIIINAIK